MRNNNRPNKKHFESMGLEELLNSMLKNLPKAKGNNQQAGQRFRTASVVFAEKAKEFRKESLKMAKIHAYFSKMLLRKCKPLFVFQDTKKIPKKS